MRLKVLLLSVTSAWAAYSTTANAQYVEISYTRSFSFSLSEDFNGGRIGTAQIPFPAIPIEVVLGSVTADVGVSFSGAFVGTPGGSSIALNADFSPGGVSEASPSSTFRVAEASPVSILEGQSFPLSGSRTDRIFVFTGVTNLLRGTGTASIGVGGLAAATAQSAFPTGTFSGTYRLNIEVLPEDLCKFSQPEAIRNPSGFPLPSCNGGGGGDPPPDDEDDSKASIYYINGIDTNRDQAASDMRALRRQLIREFGGSLPENINVAYVYNPTAGGKRVDFIEALSQKIVDFEIGLLLRNFGRASALERQAVLEVIQDAIAEDPSASVVANHIAAFRRDVFRENRKLIIVPHSQGNLFANFEYAALDADEQQSVKIVSVATPSSFTASNGTHTTDVEDAVIRLVPLARPANVANLTFFPLPARYYLDVFGHSFKRWYLFTNAPSQRKIHSDIKNALAELQITIEQ
jgi:hypothetical protein